MTLSKGIPCLEPQCLPLTLYSSVSVHSQLRGFVCYLLHLPQTRSIRSFNTCTKYVSSILRGTKGTSLHKTNTNPFHLFSSELALESSQSEDVPCIGMYLAPEVWETSNKGGTHPRLNVKECL